MLFRPTYCANCGEKIERPEWHLWTSRRFCIVCETEFRGIDLLAKAFAAIGVLGIVFGMSEYVNRSSSVNETIAGRQTRVAAEKNVVSRASIDTSLAPQAVTREPVARVQQGNAAPMQLSAVPAPTPTRIDNGPADGPVYFCGAQTKKGTPCSRRVKGNVRCFQHTGMPAMLPPEKLRAG